MPVIDSDAILDDVTTTKKEHLSYSQLNTYLRCGMQYRYSYVLGIKEPPSLAPSAGTAGHTAVEMDSRRKIRTGANMPIDEMLDLFSTSFTKETEDVVLKPDEDKGRTKDDLVHSLAMYHGTLAKEMLPLVVEKSFRLDLAIEKVRPVVGRIDLINLQGKAVGIWDNKFTMNRRPKSQMEADTSIQLTTYDMAIKQETGKDVSRLGLIQFIPPGRDSSRSPAVINVVERSHAAMMPEAREARAARVKYQYETAERGIKEAIFIPTDNPIVCGWCGYRDRCQNALVSEYEAMKIQEST